MSFATGLSIEVWLSIAGLLVSTLALAVALVCWAVPYERATSWGLRIRSNLRRRTRLWYRGVCGAGQRTRLLYQRSCRIVERVTAWSRNERSRALELVLGETPNVLRGLGIAAVCVAGFVAIVATYHPAQTTPKSPQEVEAIEEAARKFVDPRAIQGLPVVTDQERYTWTEWRVRRGCRFDQPCS